MLENNAVISLKYVTNFNPNFFIKPHHINKNNKQLDKINCKNFILFVLLIKYIFISQKKNSISIFVKPKKSNLYNILRAPYKNKMARHQITFSRFYFNISIKLNLNDSFKFKNIENVAFLLNFFKHFYSFFESNICFQHKSNFFFKFNLNDFFLI